MRKIRTGILGATGMVGQRFITLLANHPWFEVVVVAASPTSSGKSYQEAVKGRWYMNSPIPEKIKKLKVRAVENDFTQVVKEVDMVFSALDLDKEKIKQIEIAYAREGVAVVSNNSAHRWTEDVPMIMPEINPHHIKLVDLQRKNRGWDKGLIAVKPNCSIQSYVTILTALKKYKPHKVSVTSLQSISGAGKTFQTWPEMVDNVIPFIGGEEEKSEKEPLKIWGEIFGNKIKLSAKPKISARCIRVPTTNGHMAVVSVKFSKIPSKEQIIHSVSNFNPLKNLNLPSSPVKLIKYFEEDNRPQTGLDRYLGKGMSISMGRLSEDLFFDWKFIALSHNTIRGAAGGAILLAELLCKKEYII
ncbi:aspartate-semialdehyde dehydrogenase [Candidatus Gottesmanbacteria bacterium RIFCSPHIGHO2_02_FULL_40_13]|uniref:Aspartate-semialdehyde dehydrogenase n=1 Tax=Candidatus Gottesmanbacteria bacterium RIFCSPHIGHO2_02_FULL_40_13 TaxID=1798384 RepID=A0A1F6A8Y7_9BACT|nr:MAG: aspartate-semialdehyde dehydrogenase [Candidatus Gottesmanbacteria bacterium RIFCSPHIGHO2_02_FULL_40_13]